MSGQGTKLPLSDDFLADLDAAYNAELRVKLRQVFVDDLESVYESDSGDEPARSLDDLGDKLKRLRLSCRSRLHSHLLRLPPDDPLFCPVSLYGAMDMGRLEVAHTRTLAWLLDPDKEHGFGTVLVGSLFRFLGLSDRLPAFDSYRVEAERLGVSPSGEDVGRTDVWIEASWEDGLTPANCCPWLVVIEAKIDSDWQPEPLRRYDRIVSGKKKKGWEVHRVLLTPEGDSPTGKAGSNWRGMSFLDLITVFRAVLHRVKDKAGYQFLRLYIAGVLRDILKWSLPINADTDNVYDALKYLTDLGAETRGY